MPRKRVLIFSHNALSDTKNNGKTLSAIFSGWPREDLAQLYLTDEMPSYSVCGNFFRVTDAAAFHGFLRRKKAEGEVLTGEPGEVAAAQPPQGNGGALRSLFAGHLPLPELARDLVWRGDRWRSEALIQWLDSFSPEAVFFQGSNYPFAYDIAGWICGRFQAKLLLQLTDDYTYVPHPYFPFSWLNHLRYMGRLRAALAYAHWVYAIGPAMREEYAKRFGCDRISVAANCVEISPYIPEANTRGEHQDAPLRLVYAGSVHTGRWRMLATLAGAIRQLRTEGYYAALEVYTPAPPPSGVLAKFQQMGPELAYCGALTQAQLAVTMREANVLVLAEAVAWAARRATRLSLSTKIPEYMAAGRCILAAGPPEVSSIRYLCGHQAAVIADGDDPQDVLRALRETFDNHVRFETVQRALRVAQANHSREALQDEVYGRIVNSE